MAGAGEIFREDAYRRTLQTRVGRIEDGGAIVLEETIFYPNGGGQPGDRGWLETAGGERIEIRDTVNASDRSAILHLAAEGAALPAPSETVTLHLDWERRYKLMRMHTALHLLTVACPFPVTGAAVGEEESRIDFDLPDSDVDKETATEQLMSLVQADHAVSVRWISDRELDDNPGLVKSANVKPPRGMGRVRLVCIGADGVVDSQPCGGTHVARTGEIGAVHIGKIEKKGRTNRRFRVRFGSAPNGA